MNFETKLNSIENDVKAVKDALLGEGLHKDHGLIDEQKRLKQKVELHDKALWTIAGAIGLITFIASLL